jgi:hypothetical protein
MQHHLNTKNMRHNYVVYILLNYHTYWYKRALMAELIAASAEIMANPRARIRRTKYTAEQIDAELSQPPRSNRRPRKYVTDEERRLALNEAARRAYWRKKGTPPPDPNFNIALRKQVFTTEAERINAMRTRSANFYYEHHDDYKLRKCAVMHTPVRKQV